MKEKGGNGGKRVREGKRGGGGVVGGGGIVVLRGRQEKGSKDKGIEGRKIERRFLMKPAQAVLHGTGMKTPHTALVKKAQVLLAKGKRNQRKIKGIAKHERRTWGQGKEEVNQQNHPLTRPSLRRKKRLSRLTDGGNLFKQHTVLGMSRNHQIRKRERILRWGGGGKMTFAKSGGGRKTKYKKLDICEGESRGGNNVLRRRFKV